VVHETIMADGSGGGGWNGNRPELAGGRGVGEGGGEAACGGEYAEAGAQEAGDEFEEGACRE
jgi:hypothetical protein